MKTLEQPIRFKPAPPAPAEKSPRYTILDAIGDGGSGVVNQGYDNELHRVVAIKRLRSMKDGIPVSPQILLQEARLLASVNHPNIVTIYDAYVEGNEMCLVMELLTGETLDRTLQRSKFTIDEFTVLVEQTQEALLAAHSAGIVHGDLKPQNIMKLENTNGHNQYKLLDFDQARFSKTAPPRESNLNTWGSVSYMAPERIEGSAPSHAADTYAMGCIYYLSLSGQLPCQGETVVEIMAAHLRNSITPLSELRPDIPQWLCQWVHWLLTNKSSERPQSPRAVKESYAELHKRFSGVPTKFIDMPEIPAEADNWHVALGNQLDGPHSWDTIQNLIKTKTLKPTDLIKNASTYQWIKISDLLSSVR